MELTVLENLKAAQDELVSSINVKETIISKIDVKNSLNRVETGNAPIETIFTADENKSVHVFLYETEAHLYMLNCNAKGNKIKHETLDFADLEFVLRKSTYGQEITMLVKNGWYYKCNIHQNASEQLRLIAEKRNVPLKEKNESNSIAFMKNNPFAARPIITLYAMILIMGLVAVFAYFLE